MTEKADQATSGQADMKNAWFKQQGWIYRPVAWQGFLITLLFLLCCVNMFWAIDQNSHSVSDTLYDISPFWVPAFLV